MLRKIENDRQWRNHNSKFEFFTLWELKPETSRVKIDHNIYIGGLITLDGNQH